MSAGYPAWAIRRGTNPASRVILRLLIAQAMTMADLSNTTIYALATIQNTLIALQRLRLVERYGSKWRAIEGLRK